MRAADGPFYLVQSISDVPLDLSATEKTRRTVADMIEPISYHTVDDSSNHKFEATVLYSGAISRATFVIQPSGMVSMLDSQQLLSDLPIQRRLFHGFLRTWA